MRASKSAASHQSQPPIPSHQPPIPNPQSRLSVTRVASISPLPMIYILGGGVDAIRVCGAGLCPLGSPFVPCRVPARLHARPKELLGLPAGKEVASTDGEEQELGQNPDLRIYPRQARREEPPAQSPRRQAD